jgi:flagellar basal-body rod modification protein FlgD
MTSPIAGSTGSLATNTATTSMDRADQMDKDTFLKLLVAQMKYQDPSSPTDPTQFVSQTAQFTQVEKLTSLSDLTQRVYDSSRQQTATSMIGRTITFKDASGASRTGLVTGASVGSSTPNLTVAGVKVSLDDVTDVTVTGS